MDLKFDVFDPEDMMVKMEVVDQKFQLALKKAKQDLMRRIKGKVAREMAKYYLTGSTYEANTFFDYTDEGVRVSFPENYLFIEFGTGLIGEYNPHPDPSFSVEFRGYNVGKHSSNPNDYGGYGRFPFPTKDGTWKTTEGQMARPVAYNTYIFALDRIKTVYDRYLKEVGF